jgi:threonine dehydratase
MAAMNRIQRVRRRRPAPRFVALPRRRDVAEAAGRIRPFLHETPMLPAPTLGGGALLKLETVQPTGSFKVRGAFSALSLLGRDEWVVCASAGNHGLGVAYAARVLGLQATVIVPEDASPAKLAALERFPVRLVREGHGYDEAERAALALQREGYKYVSPYNDHDVICGNGTVAVELLAQVPGAMTIVVPVGGGGLISGVALWASQRAGVRVIGVESEASATMRAALDAGTIVAVPSQPTLADGLEGNIEADAVTVDMVRKHVDDVVVVSEADIAEAMRLLVADHGIVAEGAAATAVAAVMTGQVAHGAGPTVPLVTGRNVAAEKLARVLAGVNAADHG